MTFKFATFDPREGPDVFNPAFPPTPSSSPSVTLCQPCEYTYTFTKTIVRRLVAAGASLVLAARASEFHDDQIQDQRAETPFHSINLDIHPEFRQRQLKEYTLKELEVATRYFSKKKIIGEGGFGKVYQGRLADGSLVAIKRLAKNSIQGRTEFEREVMVGSIIPPRHNLLPTLGFCRTSEGRDLLLVSPLMINSSVACYMRLETRSPMDWLTRRKMALAVARGLSHLHDLNIVHRDIKPSNILLDEEFEPHIGDFGLAKFIGRRHGGSLVDAIEEAPVLPRNESKASSHGEDSDSYFTTRIMGTIGYIAPEYALKGICSVKTDVYAFGMTLLQLVTGRRPYEPTAPEMYLLDWVMGLMEERQSEILVDSNLQGAYDKEEIEKVIQLGLLCTRTVPRGRPSMAEVVQILEGHSINERWEEYHHSEDYLIPSFEVPTEQFFSSLVSPEELSGPR
ncbi:hypothetical protein BT93_E1507 [Corymbia citriodora subsp. variegata]|nr:hypothetical protein BT93_E1507 [Corymbia citriodora subsp. variegata]